MMKVINLKQSTYIEAKLVLDDYDPSDEERWPLCLTEWAECLYEGIKEPAEKQHYYDMLQFFKAIEDGEEFIVNIINNNGPASPRP